ncbi:hypothetical protein GCM10017667_63900 [Streptomyces filamentosus]|uniref:Uncharacterized protein n=1 Tax=Streptomyces filamentosus TaxID=67294 RepID=A0A919ERR4_STRFL|nr:hypothetical protein GCM10017667_63900 [Streptomyces filamentosus]
MVRNRFGTASGPIRDRLRADSGPAQDRLWTALGADPGPAQGRFGATSGPTGRARGVPRHGPLTTSLTARQPTELYATTPRSSDSTALRAFFATVLFSFGAAAAI